MTLKALYQLATSDLTTHQKTIAAAFTHLDSRRQEMIRQRVDGISFARIGQIHGVSQGTAQDAIHRGIEAMRKAIAGEPRYHQVGRGKL